MQLGRRQTPAWVLLLLIIGAAAATVAGTSQPTVLTGETQVAVADKLLIDRIILIDPYTFGEIEIPGVVHVANDRQSYTVNFIADEGDVIGVLIWLKNTAGIPVTVKIKTNAPEQFDIGYSWLNGGNHNTGPAGSPSGQLNNYVRKINGEWIWHVAFVDWDWIIQYIWVKTKPPTPSGQYEIQTWIEQAFQ